MKKIFYKLTGGRPMIKLGLAYFHWAEFELYYDYIDQFGRPWIARSRWDLFRKKENNTTRELRKLDAAYAALMKGWG